MNTSGLLALLTGLTAVIAQDVATQTRVLPQRFFGLTVNGPFTVDVSMGKGESVTVEADSAIIDYVETAVENLLLNLRFSAEKPDNLTSKNPIKITVSAKILNQVVSSGEEEIKFSSTWKAKDVQIILSGSGEITTVADVNNVNAVLSGRGNVNISGKCKNLNVSIGGIGSFNGADLHAQQVNAAMQALGDVYIYAENAISAWIPGSGNLIYGGKPTVNQQLFGKGTVSRVDQV